VGEDLEIEDLERLQREQEGLVMNTGLECDLKAISLFHRVCQGASTFNIGSPKETRGTKIAIT
jgi:hypothetical protein